MYSYSVKRILLFAVAPQIVKLGIFALLSRMAHKHTSKTCYGMNPKI